MFAAKSPKAEAESSSAPQAKGQEICAHCPLCGTVGSVFPICARHNWIARCGACDLRFAFPQPSAHELAEIYSEAYYEPFGAKLGGMAAYHSMKLVNAHRVLGIAERFVSPGRILDIGSALGDVLIAAQERGWEVRGIEPHSQAVRFANGILPMSTTLAAIEEIDPNVLGRFELVTCLDVLEHTRHPGKALAIVRQLLKRDGIAVFTVPDVGSLCARLSGERWPHYHRDHLWYFSRSTIRRLLLQQDLTPIVITNAWKVFNVQYICGVLGEHRHLGSVSTLAAWLSDHLPACVLHCRLPPLPEGLLVVAKRAVKD